MNVSFECAVCAVCAYSTLTVPACEDERRREEACYDYGWLALLVSFSTHRYLDDVLFF